MEGWGRRQLLDSWREQSRRPQARYSYLVKGRRGQQANEELPSSRGLGLGVCFSSLEAAHLRHSQWQREERVNLPFAWERSHVGAWQLLLHGWPESLSSSTGRRRDADLASSLQFAEPTPLRCPAAAQWRWDSLRTQPCRCGRTRWKFWSLNCRKLLATLAYP